MITGDVRSLARKYCDAGLAIQYDQYDTISHFLGAMLWLPGALAWVDDRLNGKPSSGSGASFHARGSKLPFCTT